MPSPQDREIFLSEHHRRGPVREAYRYVNDTNGQTAILYECGGQISYQYKGIHTAYHGEFVEGADRNSLTLRFRYDGDVKKGLKTASLLKRGEGKYSGWDSEQRHVVLTHIGTDVFCEASQVWHAL